MTVQPEFDNKAYIKSWAEEFDEDSEWYETEATNRLNALQAAKAKFAKHMIYRTFSYVNGDLYVPQSHIELLKEIISTFDQYSFVRRKDEALFFTDLTICELAAFIFTVPLSDKYNLFTWWKMEKRSSFMHMSEALDYVCEHPLLHSKVLSGFMYLPWFLSKLNMSFTLRTKKGNKTRKFLSHAHVWDIIQGRVTSNSITQRLTACTKSIKIENLCRLRLAQERYERATTLAFLPPMKLPSLVQEKYLLCYPLLGDTPGKFYGTWKRRRDAAVRNRNVCTDGLNYFTAAEMAKKNS